VIEKLTTDYNHEQALISYEKKLQDNPDDYEAWNNRGIALGYLGRHEEALASYNKAIQINPNKSEVWHTQGWELVNLGRNEEAITCFHKVLEISPDNHSAWYNLGVTLVNLGRYEEAILSFYTALKLSPDKYEAWHNHGIALANIGRYEEAILSLFQAIRIKPQENFLWNGIEALLFAIKEQFKSLGEVESRSIVIQAYENGIRILEQIGDHKRLLKFSFQLGKALLEIGNYTEAIKNLQVCEQVSQKLNDIPTLALTFFDLARLYHLTGRLEQSRLYFKDSLRLFRRLQDPEKIAAATLSLGNLEMQIGKIPQALTHLKEAETYYQSQNNSDRLQEINYLLQILQAA
jgi:tetratricopeptide (TPR) repeat protein